MLPLTQRLCALLALLGSGQFQEPESQTQRVCAQCGAVSHGLVQVQWQCWAPAAFVRGQARLDSAWYSLLKECRAFSSCSQLAGFLFLLPRVEEVGTESSQA